MNAEEQQDDVSNIAKDDENDVVGTTNTDIPGGGRGDTGVQNTPNPTTNEEQPESGISVNVDIALPSEKEDHKFESPQNDRTVEVTDENPVTSPGPISIDEELLLNSDDETSTKESFLTDKEKSDVHTTGIKTSTNISVNIPSLETAEHISVQRTETGYKETAIDDESDSELGLFDNEDNMQTDVQPLTDDALKLLDEELGIADNVEEKNQAVATQLIEDSNEISSLTKETELVLKHDVGIANIEKDKTIDEAQPIKPKEQSEEQKSKVVDALSLFEQEYSTNNTVTETHKNKKLNLIACEKEHTSLEKQMETSDNNSKYSDENLVNNDPITDSKVFKETVLDEVSVSDMVDWNDDDVDQMQADVKPLSDDALKQLDQELGIADNVEETAPATPITSEPVGYSKESVKDTGTVKQNPSTTIYQSENLEHEKNISVNNEKKITTVKMPDSLNLLSSIKTEDKTIKRDTPKTEILQDVKFVEIKKEVVESSTEELTDTNKIPMEVDNSFEKSFTKINNEQLLKENTDVKKIGLEVPPVLLEDNVTEVDKIKILVKDEVIDNVEREITEPLKYLPSEVTKEQNRNDTHDLINDSIGIKTDHRINRPDVMLDIPTQEFIDFDDDEITKSDMQEMECDNNSLTSKTVSEIVNQLAKSKSLAKGNITEEQIKAKTEVTKIEDTYNDLKKEAHQNTPNQYTSESKENKIVDIKAKLENNDDTKTKLVEPENIETDLKNNESKATLQSTKINEPSTSEVNKEMPEDTKLSDNAEEVTEDTDTLGLLAESSRIHDEDEEQEQEDDEGDVEYDDDFDHDDESSNQMTTAEHSEDSNTPPSETDQPKEGEATKGEKRNFIKVSDGKDMPQHVTVEKDQADTTTDIVSGDKADNLASDVNDELNAETEKETKAEEDLKPRKLSDILKSSDKLNQTSKERRRSILLDLLSKGDNEDAPLNTEASTSMSKKLEAASTQAQNIVELEESDDEDIKEVKGDAKTEVLSVVAKKETKITPEVKDGDSENRKEIVEDKEEINKENEEISPSEIFNLDSDEEISDNKISHTKSNSCINNNCTSDKSAQYYVADKACMSYFNATRRRGAVVCLCCLEFVAARNEGLVNGIKDMRALMDLEMAGPGQQPVEISDSESDGEVEVTDNEPIGARAAKMMEEQLAELMNSSWVKYDMSGRLKEAEDFLAEELKKMDEQSAEIQEMLSSCEKATDKLRMELYKTFDPDKQELPALYIHDTPIASYFRLEAEEKSSDLQPSRYPKRQSTTPIDNTPAKKPAIPMEYTPLSSSLAFEGDQTKQEDDKDVSLVNLSAEAAPADLPPLGELTRLPLRVGMSVYAMKNAFGAWLDGTILEILPKTAGFTQCRVKFEHSMKKPCRVLSAQNIAYTEPSDVRMTIGTRVIALFKNTGTDTKKDSYYSGVVAEIPNPVNSYRYLVFSDDGYAQYVHHKHTRLVAESSAQVWEEVHPFSRDFVYNYLLNYPERPMVRMHKGQTISVESNGKWFETRVITVDASLVQVQYLEENRTEWIYRGSNRLRPLFVEFQAAKGGARTRLPRSTRNSSKINMPYVEYTRSAEQMNKQPPPPQTEELRRLRAVAKKSTGPAPPAAVPPPPTLADGVTSRVVYYTPKHAVRPHKLTPHTCGPRCRRTDVLTLIDLRTYNPLAKPLLSGWERQITRYKGHRAVMYRAPCGRRVRGLAELHRYLSALRSDFSVDLFDFNPATHCLAEFVLTKYNVGKKDLSHGKENVPVACVNYYDNSLPEFCSYNTERTPTAGVPLNLDPDFLCGCDCTDDCVDKSKCACWRMTLEGARTIGMDDANVGYKYRRLLEPLPTGIYECNSRCKCKNTCLNRVAQHPLQLKLQVFKTINRGWGIRALNDVPKGAFLCIYAGNLLTDATANLDGLNEGDEYLAELDYIEVVEGMKEGYEENVVEPDSKDDKKKESKASDSGGTSDSAESEGEDNKKTDMEDDDFRPGYIGLGLTEFSKRLRKRDKKKNSEDSEEKEKDGPTKADLQEKIDDDGCITISDDEEVREPARFTAQEGMGDKKFVSKYKSIRDYFGQDESCYIMDAKVQGNIGRYLNHSCSPNVFVQNVFVDTHDPRFPWVSFFALHHIRAGTELTWNYNYDVGSVPGKVLYCFCGAFNCRGRLL